MTPRTLPTGADEAGGPPSKFYEIPDNLDPQLVALSAQVQLDRSVSLAKQGLFHEAQQGFEEIFLLGEPALTALDRLIARADSDPDESSDEQIASALTGKLLVLSGLQRPEEALLLADEVIARFADTQSPILEFMVAAAEEARQDIIDASSD